MGPAWSVIQFITLFCIHLKGNMTLIMSICESFPDQESDKPKMRELGHKLYHYEKSGPKRITNKAKKSVGMQKRATIQDSDEAKGIEEALAKSVGDKDFASWAGSSSLKGRGDGGKGRAVKGRGRGKEAGTRSAEEEAKALWMKTAGQAKNALSKQIENGKEGIIKMENDAQGVISRSFRVKFTSFLAKMENAYGGLTKKILGAQTADAKLFLAKTKHYQDPWITINPLVDEYKEKFRAMLAKHI